MNKWQLEFSFEIPRNFFGNNEYFVNFEIINVKREHHLINYALNFNVEYVYYNNIGYASWENELLRPLLKWDLKQ